MKKRKLAVLLIVIIFSFVGGAGNTEKMLNRNITNNKQLTQKEKLDDYIRFLNPQINLIYINFTS